jgi:hypothetical protein
MKKETILEALKNVGVELEEEKFKELYKTLQTENGKDITAAKEESANKDQEIATLKAKYENDIKVKDEALKKYNDAEIAELKKFKEDTTLAQKNAKQNSALKSLIGDEKYHFDKKAIDIISTVAKSEAKFKDNDELENSEELMTKLVDKYKDFIVETKTDGANPLDENKQNNKPVDLDKLSYEDYVKFRKAQN